MPPGVLGQFTCSGATGTGLQTGGREALLSGFHSLWAVRAPPAAVGSQHPRPVAAALQFLAALASFSCEVRCVTGAGSSRPAGSFLRFWVAVDSWGGTLQAGCRVPHPTQLSLPPPPPQLLVSVCSVLPEVQVPQGPASLWGRVAFAGAWGSAWFWGTGSSLRGEQAPAYTCAHLGTRDGGLGLALRGW